MINLQHALDIRLNVENEQGDPAGTTTEYRLLVPALDYRGAEQMQLRRSNTSTGPKAKLRNWFEMVTERGQASPSLSGSSERSPSIASPNFTDGKGGRRDSLSPPDPSVIPSGAVSANHVPPGVKRRSIGAPSPAGGVSIPVSGPPPTVGGVPLQRSAPLNPQRGSFTSNSPHSPRGAPPVSLENTAAGRGLVGGRRASDGGRRGSFDGGRRGSMDAPQRIKGNFGGYE